VTSPDLGTGTGGRLVVLVRHGEASAGWDGAADPRLSELGRAQAAQVAEDLEGGGATALVVSPLRRTRETALPIAELLGLAPVVEPLVGEVVAPPGHDSLEARGPWLRTFMAGSWDLAEPALRAWREGVVSALAALPDGAVVVTHFVAINVAVGWAQGDDRVVSFRPGHCSRTTLRVGDGGLELVGLGAEARTAVR